MSMWMMSKMKVMKMMVESGEECFEGNGEQDQLGNQGDNDDGEQDEDVICKVGFAMHKCSR